MRRAAHRPPFVFPLTSDTKSLGRVVPPAAGCRLKSQTSPEQGVHSMRLRFAVSSPSHARRGSRNRLGLGDHRPQRQRRLPEGGAERPGARQLQRAREALERARVGRDQRAPPDPGRKQVEFKLDYSGGYGTYKRDVWKTFKDACRPYDGPDLQWFVAGCKAADGSYWALSPGSGCCRTTASRRRRSSPSGSCGCRTSAARCPCSTCS